MKALMIFMYVTNVCNRHCLKCYRSKDEQSMSYEVATDSASWIASICKEKNVELLRVNFLGGEPFLNIDVIFHFIDTLRSVIPEQVKPYTDGQFLLFTNGDHLTDELLKECKSRNMYIILNPTYDSLDIVEKKIEKIKYFCHGCSLAVALNDVNMPRIVDLTKLAINHNCTIRINRLYDGGKDPEYIKEYGNQMRMVLKLLLSSKKPIWPAWIVESTYPIYKGEKNCYACGVWHVNIDPDGTLLSCNADPNTRIGHISTHKHWSDLKMHQRWSAKNIQECQNCEWITLCQGGCPYTKKLCFGDYNHKSPFCEEFKTLFPLLMQLTQKWEEYTIQRSCRKINNVE